MPLHNKTRELDRDVVHHGQVDKPEQLGSPVLQQNVHAACSELLQTFCTVRLIPANWLFQ